MFPFLHFRPLARTVLGQNLVQGIDYAYTLQGWLNYIVMVCVPLPWQKKRGC